MMEFCELCGKLAHREKVRRDQCRLFTAILGKGWGLDSCDNIQPDKFFEFEKSENSPYEDEEDDLDLLLPCMESEEVNEEPKQEEKIQIVDKVIFNRQVNNNSSGKKNTGSSLMKNREQSFSVKDIVKSEENETVKEKEFIVEQTKLTEVILLN